MKKCIRKRRNIRRIPNIIMKCNNYEMYRRAGVNLLSDFYLMRFVCEVI